MGVLILILFSVSSWGGTRTAKALRTELTEREWKASVAEGFHFNLKAPNSLTADGQNILPIESLERTLRFPKSPAPWKAARATLYVCDDALTFCETNVIAVVGAEAKVTADSAANPTKGKLNKFGFIQDDLPAALKKAEAKKQLVLIDFSARWCPSCVRLENEAFATAEFKRMTANLVKVRIDTDRFENGILSEKYKIRGIPTQLVVNREGAEVSRLDDFQAMPVLAAFFKSVADNPVSLRELEERAKGGDPILAHALGQRLLAAGQAEEALKYLRPIEPPPVELYPAEVHAAQMRFDANKTLKPELVATLKSVIAKDGESTRSLPWRALLIEQVETPAEKQVVKVEALALADRLLADSVALKAAAKSDDNGEFFGLEPLMVAMYRADIIEASGAPEEDQVAAWQVAAETGRSLKISPKRTGSGMRFLSVLLSAKQFADAEKWVLALKQHDPQNPELGRGHLRVLVELKRWPEAEKLARLTLKKSYGRNEFWAAETLTKVLIELKRYDEASRLIETYLGREESRWPGVQKVVKSLQDLRQKIPKA